MTHHKEQLKREFNEHFNLTPNPIVEIDDPHGWRYLSVQGKSITDFFLSRTIPTASLIEMKERMVREKKPVYEGMKEEQRVINEWFNVGISLCIAMVEELLESNKE